MDRSEPLSQDGRRDTLQLGRGRGHQRSLPGTQLVRVGSSRLRCQHIRQDSGIGRPVHVKLPRTLLAACIEQP
ncbi:hypothetical protein [Streptomyces sp. NPDC050848]|uniref:hypothetical protein n=1 Tax=Streptomyces sp. NPDC050848 TaxID=3155791 RepID=UPI0033E3A7B3